MNENYRFGMVANCTYCGNDYEGLHYCEEMAADYAIADGLALLQHGVDADVVADFLAPTARRIARLRAAEPSTPARLVAGDPWLP